MTIHAHITGGTVDRWGDLPRVWRNDDGTVTTGFDQSDPATLAAAGWHPVTDDRPTPGPGQWLGPLRWHIDGTDITVTADLHSPPIPPTPGLRTADPLITDLRS